MIAASYFSDTIFAVLFIVGVILIVSYYVIKYAGFNTATQGDELIEDRNHTHPTAEKHPTIIVKRITYTKFVDRKFKLALSAKHYKKFASFKHKLVLHVPTDIMADAEKEVEMFDHFLKTFPHDKKRLFGARFSAGNGDVIVAVGMSSLKDKHGFLAALREQNVIIL